MSRIKSKASLTIDKLRSSQDAVQIRVFTKWCNLHLKKKGIQIDSVTNGFSSGLNLCALLSAITGDNVKAPNGPNKLKQKAARKLRSFENINKALNYIEKDKKIDLGGLVGARNIHEAETDADISMILGLIWTLVLRLQVSQCHREEHKNKAGKSGFLLWCQHVTEGYHRGGKAIKDFSRSWMSGLPFVAIIHHFRPDLIKFDKNQSAKDACENAFSVAESIGIDRILDVDDVSEHPPPDDKIVMAYVAEYVLKFVVEARNKPAQLVGPSRTVDPPHVDPPHVDPPVQIATYIPPTTVTDTSIPIRAADDTQTPSRDLLWILTKRNNAFLVKRSGHYFSTAPNNPTNLSSYNHSGIVNSGSVGIETRGKNVVLTQREAGKRSFNVKVTNLTRYNDQPAKTEDQSAAVLGLGSKKAFAAAALAKWSRLSQSTRLNPRQRRARNGRRAQKRAAAAAVDDDEE